MTAPGWLSRRRVMIGAAPLLWWPPAARAVVLEGEADVRSAGAVGDGITDDRPALQQVIDRARHVVFPPGRYRIGGPLVPRSGQVWRGAGASISEITLGPDNLTPPFNAIHGSGTLTDWQMIDLGVVGNQPVQTTRDRTGQSCFGLYLRGDVRQITLLRCRFAQLGEGRSRHATDDTGGGGVVIGPAPTDEDQALEDIAVLECVFEHNGNVPGVYINGGTRAGRMRRGVRIVGNRFTGVPTATRFQNCIYVLAEHPAAAISGVTIADNRCEIDTSIDACIELNHVDGFRIAGNHIHVRSGAPGSSAMLIRDGSRRGVITGNVLVETGHMPDQAGILLVNFQNPGTQEDIAITHNSIAGFGWRSIGIDRGSRGVLVANNRVSATTRPLECAVRVAAAQHVRIEALLVSDATLALAGFGTTVENRIEDLVASGVHMVRCGGTDAPISFAGALTSRVRLSNLRLVDPIPGTPALVRGPASLDIRDSDPADLPLRVE